MWGERLAALPLHVSGFAVLHTKTMHTKRRPSITFDYELKRWVSPSEWRYWEYMNDPSNFPDPDLLTFKDEYDYGLRRERGMIYRLHRHLFGGEIEVFNADRQSHIRRIPPKVFEFYIFCNAAVKLINDPSLYRSVHEGRLNGSTVANYANLVHLDGLIPGDVVKIDTEESEKTYVNLKNKKNLVSVEFSACYARLFNKTSGLQNYGHLTQQYTLKTVPREDKLALCPCCSSFYTQVTRDVIKPGTVRYEKAKQAFADQIEYDQRRKNE
jgi:hypothetical protein